MLFLIFIKKVKKSEALFFSGLGRTGQEGILVYFLKRSFNDFFPVTKAKKS